MTAPYLPAAAGMVADSLEHHTIVTAHPVDAEPFTLDVESLTVTMAEDMTPHATAQIVCAVPAAQAQLDALDPRRQCRITIEAGYTYPDLITDVQLLADLHIRTREVGRPGNQMDLTAASDEALLIDYLSRYYAAQTLPTSGINEAAAFLISYGTQPAGLQPGGYTLNSDYPDGYAAADLAGVELERGNDFMSVMTDCAALAGAWVYCGADRIWRIRARPTLSDPVHHLTVGQRGTIISSSATLSREVWANTVLLKYEYEDADGASRHVYGQARVASGPFDYLDVGYRMFYESNNGRRTNAQAEKIAASKLAQLVTRGRNVALTAHAAYWIRPGDTITAQLPTGGAETHIVKRVTFKPIIGAMDIDTRQPLDVTITTGE